jgi:hypothetical protein
MRWGAVEVSLLAAATLAATSAVHAAGRCVVAETLLVMRHVGVQLSTRRLLEDLGGRFFQASLEGVGGGAYHSCHFVLRVMVWDFRFMVQGFGFWVTS